MIAGTECFVGVMIETCPEHGRLVSHYVFFDFEEAKTTMEAMGDAADANHGLTVSVYPGTMFLPQQVN